MDIFICVLQERYFNQFADVKSLTDTGFDLVVQSIFPDLDDGFEGVCLAIEEARCFDVNDIIFFLVFLIVILGW